METPEAQGQPVASRGRPRGATRERILETALELFNEQGYEKTSLREIAERLGFTKAALYYHFERKEDILLALHLRLHALGRDALEQLGNVDDEPPSMADWVQLLDSFIDQVVAHQALFLLHERNHNAFEQLEQSASHQAEHDSLEQQLRRVLADGAIPLRQRVRLACSIGAVFGALIGAGDAFGGESKTEVADLVRESMHSLLGVPAPAGSST